MSTGPADVVVRVVPHDQDEEHDLPTGKEPEYWRIAVGNLVRFLHAAHSSERAAPLEQAARDELTGGLRLVDGLLYDLAALTNNPPANLSQDQYRQLRRFRHEAIVSVMYWQQNLQSDREAHAELVARAEQLFRDQPIAPSPAATAEPAAPASSS